MRGTLSNDEIMALFYGALKDVGAQHAADRTVFVDYDHLSDALVRTAHTMFAASPGKVDAVVAGLEHTHMLHA
jgi:hypothetical protein